MTTLDYSSKSPEGACEELGTTLERGLDPFEAKKRLEAHGANELRGRGVTWWEIFANQFRSPFIYLLLGAAAISLAVGERLDAGVILLYVSLNALLGFYQEFRSEQALRLLRQYLVLMTKVRRAGTESQIEAELLVAGDIVVLETGDVVPADLRLLDEYDISMDESVLTGESVSVRKSAAALASPAKDAYGATNLCFAGTTVVSGKGFGLVIATGADTNIGTIASLTVGAEETSAFAKGIASFSQFILRLIILTIVFVFVANIIIKGSHANILELLIFSIALAVSVIPEALPVVTTLSLSRGALRLAKRQVVVKRLSAIEDLGSIEVLCTDKTGTLTENKLTVSDIFGKREDVVRYGNLGSGIQGERHEPFDIALWNALMPAEQRAVDKAELKSELPFDPKRRRNSVIIKSLQGYELVTRGAYDDVAKLCRNIPSDDDAKAQAWISERGKRGERVLAVARKKLVDGDAAIETEEHGLEFVGLASFVDPIKESTAAAIAKAKALGIKVKIITGDGPEVAGAVAQAIGLVKSAKSVLTGAQFGALSAAEQQLAVQKYSVFARITPEQKFAIVRTLQNRYEVGFLGEGINDAPALKAAGVGIVVKGASGVAQEAADIILLEKDLGVIIDGINEGRVVFANTLKYLKAVLASNFGNFYSIAISSLFIDFLPMLPIQILLVNLLSDFPMISISTDTVDSVEIGRPEKYRVHDIVILATILGIVSTLFDFVFFALFSRISPGVLQTNWFVESILTELVFLYSIRTRFFFLRAKRPSSTLLSLSVVACIATLTLPMTALGRSIFHFVSPTGWQLFMTLGIVAAYFIATETTKLLYYRFFDGRIIARRER